MTNTHEQFIQRVRDLAVTRLNEAEAKLAMDCKLVYGAGPANGTRGLTHYGKWKNGDVEPHPIAEICAFGESSWVQVAGTTLHELAHVIAGWGTGHGPEWKAACERLGLRIPKAAGQYYCLAYFDPRLRFGLANGPIPNDGLPHGGFSQWRGIAPKPCPLGVGTRGGTSRGKGSGSRLRKWICDCGVIARVSRDEFDATCNLCNSSFKRG